MRRAEARDGRGSHDAMRCDVEHVHDETSGIGPGPSGCRDGVGTSVERVITGTNVMPERAGRVSRRFCMFNVFSEV